MGKRGPKPKSASLKLAEGTRKDRIQGPEPAIIPGAPDCPAHLDPVAKAEFARLVVLLRDAGILSRADGGALSVCCEAYSDWLAVGAEVKKLGRLIDTAEGTQKLNPLVGVAIRHRQTYFKTLAEFGLNPSARGRVTRVTAEVPQDDLESFLSTKKG